MDRAQHIRVVGQEAGIRTVIVDDVVDGDCRPAEGSDGVDVVERIVDVGVPIVIMYGNVDQLDDFPCTIHL